MPAWDKYFDPKQATTPPGVSHSPDDGIDDSKGHSYRDSQYNKRKEIPLTKIPEDLDFSLEATHTRLIRALARKTAQLEKQSEKGLSAIDLEALSKCSSTWRQLTATKPVERDPSQMTDEELAAALSKK